MFPLFAGLSRSPPKKFPGDKGLSVSLGQDSIRRVTQRRVQVAMGAEAGGLVRDKSSMGKRRCTTGLKIEK